jgi:hypothetical protein
MRNKLTLTTLLEKQGNDTDCQIDTLGMAIDGQTYNELEEYNFDWLFDVENSTKTYWLDNEAEDYFKKSLTKQQILAYADDLPAYNNALQEYKDTNFNDVRAGDYNPDIIGQKELAEAMEKNLSIAQADLYHDWLHGDYRGNFDGIIPKANRLYSDYGITIDYDEKADVLSFEIEDDTMQLLKEAGNIERKTIAQVRQWLESDINYTAEAKHAKNKREAEARHAENQKTREYREKQAEAKKESKKAELLALIN